MTCGRPAGSRAIMARLPRNVSGAGNDLESGPRQVVGRQEVCQGLDEHRHGAFSLLVVEELGALPLVLAEREEAARLSTQVAHLELLERLERRQDVHGLGRRVVLPNLAPSAPMSKHQALPAVPTQPLACEIGQRRQVGRGGGRGLPCPRLQRNCPGSPTQRPLPNPPSHPQARCDRSTQFYPDAKSPTCTRSVCIIARSCGTCFSPSVPPGTSSSGSLPQYEAPPSPRSPSHGSSTLGS